MIKYKIDILKELSNKGFTSTKLRNEKIMSQATMSNIRKGKQITLQTLNDICLMLRLQPGDIVEFIPTDEEKIKFY